MAGRWRSPQLWPPWAGPLAVATFAAVLYLPTLWAGYAIDDHPALLANPVVRGDVALWEVFVREFWGRPLSAGASTSYRPLTTLTLAIEHRITEAPWIHHLGNVIAYAVACAMTVRVARRWCAEGVAIAVGIAFAALPIHVENVASIVGRADVLAAIACLVAIDVGLPRGDRPPTKSAGVAAGAAYLVGLLCKESVAVLPALAAWLSWLHVRRTPKLGWRAMHPVATMGVVGLAYLVARQPTFGVQLPDDFIAAGNLLILRSGFDRVWGNLAVAGHYAELVVVPLRLCTDHTYAEIIPPTRLFEHDALWAWLGVLLLALVVADGIRAVRGRSPGLGVAAGLAYVLVGQWIVDLPVIVAERLALWPTVWLMLAIAAAIERPWSDLEPDRKRRIALMLLVLLGLACARTVDRMLDWRDGLTLQRTSLQSCPRSVHTRFILAQKLRDAGQPAEAVWHYGLAGAGRAAFPEPFDVPALQAEDTQSLAKRLPRLPELVGADDPHRYWASLHAYLVAQGAHAEAELVRRLARHGTGS